MTGITLWITKFSSSFFGNQSNQVWITYKTKTGDKEYIICHFCEWKGHFPKKTWRALHALNIDMVTDCSIHFWEVSNFFYQLIQHKKSEKCQDVSNIIGLKRYSYKMWQALLWYLFSPICPGVEMALVTGATPGVPHLGQIKSQHLPIPDLWVETGATLYLRSWGTTSRTGPLTH